MSRFEPGCYGDGTFGHQHTRECCADLIDNLIEEYYAIGSDAERAGSELAQLLQDGDDVSEEQEACDWLNEFHGREGYYWGWQDGDFGLWPGEGE